MIQIICSKNKDDKLNLFECYILDVKQEMSNKIFPFLSINTETCFNKKIILETKQLIYFLLFVILRTKSKLKLVICLLPSISIIRLLQIFGIVYFFITHTLRLNHNLSMVCSRAIQPMKNWLKLMMQCSPIWQTKYL